MSSTPWLLLLLLMSFRTVAVSHLMPKFPLCSVQDVFSVFLCKRFELVRHDTPQSVANTTTQYTDSTPAILHLEYFAGVPAFRLHLGQTLEMFYHFGLQHIPVCNSLYTERICSNRSFLG